MAASLSIFLFHYNTLYFSLLVWLLQNQEEKSHVDPLSQAHRCYVLCTYLAHSNALVFAHLNKELKQAFISMKSQLLL
jgi:hypothetical protein